MTVCEREEEPKMNGCMGEKPEEVRERLPKRGDRKSGERTYEEVKEDQKERGSKGTRWEVDIAVVLSERGKQGRNPSEVKK